VLKLALEGLPDNARLVSSACLLMAAAYLLHRPNPEDSPDLFSGPRMKEHYMLAIGMLHYYAILYDPMKRSIEADLRHPSMPVRIVERPIDASICGNWMPVEVNLVVSGLSKPINLAGTCTQWPEVRKQLLDFLSSRLALVTEMVHNVPEVAAGLDEPTLAEDDMKSDLSVRPDGAGAVYRSLGAILAGETDESDDEPDDELDDDAARLALVGLR